MSMFQTFFEIGTGLGFGLLVGLSPVFLIKKFMDR